MPDVEAPETTIPKICTASYKCKKPAVFYMREGLDISYPCRGHVNSRADKVLPLDPWENYPAT